MISGYLSLDGTFYNAPYWSHMSTAQRIVEDNCWFSDNKRDNAEDILLKRGFICIRTSDMYKRGRDSDGGWLLITDVQQNWLQDRWNEFNQAQKKDCTDLIEAFGDWSRFSAEVLRDA